MERYLLPRIVRKNQLLSRKRLKARNMLNGRKPWKPKCNGKLMVGVYVDDIVIGGKSEKKTRNSSWFLVKNLM